MNFSIVDTEIKVIHPEARKINYAKINNEYNIQKFIYSQPDINKSIKLADIKFVLNSMKKNNIDFGILSGLPWLNYNITKKNNDYINNCLKLYPNKFKAFYLANTLNIEQSIKDIENLNKKKYVGVDFVPHFQTHSMFDDRLKPLIKVIRENDLFLRLAVRHPHQSHQAFAMKADEAVVFIEKNPNIKIILGHLGGGLALYALHPPLSRMVRKIYFSTSVSSTMELVKLSSEINPDNIIFGTDFPFNHCFDQASPLKKILNMSISKEKKNKILEKTSYKLFKFKRKKNK